MKKDEEEEDDEKHVRSPFCAIFFANVCVHDCLFRQIQRNLMIGAAC